MSDEKVETDAAVPAEGPSSEPEKKRGIDWADPNIPIGNAPPMPRWPLVVISVAWVGWIVFLVVMLMS